MINYKPNIVYEPTHLSSGALPVLYPLPFNMFGKTFPINLPWTRVAVRVSIEWK